MPITVERLEPLIYLGTYIDTVILDEVYESAEALRRLLNEDQAPFHVVILEGKYLKKMPFDVRGLGRAILPNCLGTLCVNAPRISELLGGMISKFSGQSIEFYATMEEALAQAKSLIALKKESLT
ncbi:MAG: hypothetical protein MUF87_13035 [Anaerolineae bacterium]|jgi:hypothetical protein|nr:hypothetical protein [Anaerolineae bacterium]